MNSLEIRELERRCTAANRKTEKKKDPNGTGADH